jgi:hypothetical protein
MLHGMIEFLYLAGFAHSIYIIYMPLTSFYGNHYDFHTSDR